MVVLINNIKIKKICIYLLLNHKHLFNFVLLFFDLQMGRWEVFLFHKDNSIEAVPDTWVKKGLCAWPKSSKNIKRLIKNRYKPNKTDFLYYPSRILGNKNYGTYL